MKATPVRLVVFAVFAIVAALQWGTLIADPPTTRLIAVALVASAVAAGLSLHAAFPASWRRRLAAALIVLAGAAGALVAVGFAARDLPPWHWDRLADGIDIGLKGLGGSFDYPLTGAGDWARLLLIAPVAPLLVAAAALGFRPGRDAGRPPVAGLVLLVTAFTIPAVARPIGAPVLWGAVLLVLTAAWLWGERVGRLPAVALVAGLGVVAIPVATSLAGDDPPIDYRTWTVPGGSEGVSFDWSQSYGPIDWPRNGEPVLEVHTDRANFWRAEVLDEFYGDVWRRSGGGGQPVPAEPIALGSAESGSVDSGRDWTQRARFEVLSMDSPLIVSPGLPTSIDGVDGAESDPDGTTRLESEPLTAGSEYTVDSYAPNPRPALLRRRSRHYRLPLSPYTQLAVPQDASLEAIVAPTHVAVPLWGEREGRASAEQALGESAYGQVAHLAERLTAGEANAYDAATAIQNHLRSRYTYDEKPPRHRLPLRAFLFQDRIGYCQQFAGAMALMLRTVGIPARVAAGFAPGTPLTKGEGFEVTDLDAHAWVEVYFNGIGWVPFDPTPPVAPAQAPEVRGGASFSLGAGSFGEFQARGESRPGKPTETAAAAPPPAGEGGGGAPISPLAGLAVLGAFALVPPLRSIRHRRLPPGFAEEREVEELRAVLRTTGWSRRESTTLLVTEGRLREARLTAAAAYVRGFRERRYGPADVPPPSLGERRSARRDLASAGGIARRLRMLVLMPPGGPRRVRRQGRRSMPSG